MKSSSSFPPSSVWIKIPPVATIKRQLGGILVHVFTGGDFSTRVNAGISAGKPPVQSGAITEEHRQANLYLRTMTTLTIRLPFHSCEK